MMVTCRNDDADMESFRRQGICRDSNHVLLGGNKILANAIRFNNYNIKERRSRLHFQLYRSVFHTFTGLINQCARQSRKSHVSTCLYLFASCMLEPQTDYHVCSRAISCLLGTCYEVVPMNLGTMVPIMVYSDQSQFGLRCSTLFRLWWTDHQLYCPSRFFILF